MTRYLALALVLGIAPAHAEPPVVNTPTASPIVTVANALDQTASVIEGTAGYPRYTYTTARGPYTETPFIGVMSYAGEIEPTSIVIRQQGGRLPNGNFLKVSPLPEFTAGQRYILFLRNTSWKVSPIVAASSFLAFLVNFQTVLVHPENKEALRTITTLDVEWMNTMIPPAAAGARPMTRAAFVALIKRMTSTKALRGHFYNEPI